jgi:hypothetical protein
MGAARSLDHIFVNFRDPQKRNDCHATGFAAVHQRNVMERRSFSALWSH